jgi:putative ABC transport system substrate-binding protein
MVAFLTLVLLVAPLAAEVQPPAKIPRIGILRPGSPPDPLIEAFRQGLRELATPRGETSPSSTVGRRAETSGFPTSPPTWPASKWTSSSRPGSETRRPSALRATIPIVMQVSIDPVADGLVASLARPGGNITGLATSTEDVPGKWMELLKDILPGVSRVAVLFDPTSSPAAQLKASEAAARSLRVRLQTLKVGRSDELGPAFAAAQKNRAEGLIIFGSAFVFAHRTRLVELAAIHRLPTIFDQRQFVVSSGGLMSYGPNVHDLFRRAATYVDKILKGAKPADLPVEQPTKFELLINLKTAKTLGLTIPPAVLARADEIIE